MTDVWDHAADRQQVMAVVQAAIDASADGDPLYGVTVSYGLPKNLDTSPADLFIVGEIRGAATADAFGSGARTWNAAYILETGVKVNRKGVALEEADARCMEILRAIYGLLFVTPRLDRAPDPRPNTATYPSRIEGPNASALDLTNTVSMALLDIDCRISVHGTP